MPCTVTLVTVDTAVGVAITDRHLTRPASRIVLDTVVVTAAVALLRVAVTDYVPAVSTGRPVGRTNRLLADVAFL